MKDSVRGSSPTGISDKTDSEAVSTNVTESLSGLTAATNLPLGDTASVDEDTEFPWTGIVGAEFNTVVAGFNCVFVIGFGSSVGGNVSFVGGTGLVTGWFVAFLAQDIVTTTNSRINKNDCEVWLSKCGLASRCTDVYVVEIYHAIFQCF